MRKARNFSHKLTDDSRSSPRPAPSDSFSSHGDDADGTDSSGRERALSTARNFIRNIRRTLRRRSSNTDNEPGMNDMEDQDDVSSESGSIHSLSPLSRMKTDGVDFEKIPDEFVSMEHDDSADSEEDFDHPVVSDKTPDNVDDDKGEDAGEESDSKPSLIRKEISRHLTSSVSIRPRISANINPHYMNFSFMTSPKPRSLTAVDPSKPPIPVPRNSKTPPTLVRNIRPTSPEEDPGVLKSYDKDTDSEEEGGGLTGKFPGSTSAANTLSGTNPVQPSSTAPPTRTRHLSSTPPPTSAQHPSSTPPPTSTQHPSSTPPPSSTQHPSSAPPPTGSQQLSSSLTSVSTFEEKRTERIALNGSVSVPTENRSENQSIDCCQNGVSSSTGESPLLKLKGRSPVPPTTPPFTRSETTQSISTSSDPESGRVFGRQSAIGPPPTPPKKPSSFKFQDVSSSRESSPRPGRNTQPFPGRNAQISSEARGGYNSPKLSKDPPVEQSRNLLVRSSRSRQTTTGAAGSGSHVQGSQVDQLELGESSSNTTTDARIRELISYENFLPLAWRSKPATKSATISEEAGSEVGIERSTLTRSLRLRTQIRAMKEDDSERDYRKSMTLPHPGDMRPFTSVVPGIAYLCVLHHICHSCLYTNACCHSCLYTNACCHSCLYTNACCHSCLYTNACCHSCLYTNACCHSCLYTNACCHSCLYTNACCHSCLYTNACCHSCLYTNACCHSCLYTNACCHSCLYTNACCHSCPYTNACCHSCLYTNACCHSCLYTNACCHSCLYTNACCHSCLYTNACCHSCLYTNTCCHSCLYTNACCHSCLYTNACCHSCLYTNACCHSCLYTSAAHVVTPVCTPVLRMLSLLSVHQCMLSLLSVHQCMLSLLSVHQCMLSLLSVHQCMLSLLSVHQCMLSLLSVHQCCACCHSCLYTNACCHSCLYTSACYHSCLYTNACCHSCLYTSAAHVVTPVCTPVLRMLSLLSVHQCMLSLLSVHQCMLSLLSVHQCMLSLLSVHQCCACCHSCLYTSAAHVVTPVCTPVHVITPVSILYAYLLVLDPPV